MRRILLNIILNDQDIDKIVRSENLIVYKCCYINFFFKNLLLKMKEREKGL